MNHTITAVRPQQREDFADNMKFTLFLSRSRLKKCEIVGACGTNGKKRHTYRNVVGKRGDNLEDLAMDVKIILKWIFTKYDEAWTGQWLGSCELGI
jgi:translation initiation factor RLI1